MAPTEMDAEASVPETSTNNDPTTTSQSAAATLVEFQLDPLQSVSNSLDTVCCVPRGGIVFPERAAISRHDGREN